MNNIHEIVSEIDNGLKNHYFKDICFIGLVDNFLMRDGNLSSNLRNTINTSNISLNYDGNNGYIYIQDDSKSLIVYHRIRSIENEENLELGFGRNAETVEIYNNSVIFYGNQSIIKDDCKDINQLLSNEFKTLIPRNIGIDFINNITVGSINIDKQRISAQEGIKFKPNDVLFSIDYKIMIKFIENCNILNCN